MKNKSKHAQLKRKKEFRYKKIEILTRNGLKKKISHPAYIFLEKGNLYIYVTITHSESVENYLVLKLSENPNPLDKKDSYWIAEIRQDTKDKFEKRKDDWKMNEIDDLKIRELFEKTKK